jgi:hypothetical protein
MIEEIQNQWPVCKQCVTLGTEIGKINVQFVENWKKNGQ